MNRSMILRRRNRSLKKVNITCLKLVKKLESGAAKFIMHNSPNINSWRSLSLTPKPSPNIDSKFLVNKTKSIEKNIPSLNRRSKLRVRQLRFFRVGDKDVISWGPILITLKSLELTLK